jgi:hypothetical protein
MLWLPFFATFLVIVSGCLDIRHVLTKTPCCLNDKFIGLNGTYLMTYPNTEYMLVLAMYMRGKEWDNERKKGEE